MKSWNKVLSKKIAPVLLLSCVALVGCSENSAAQSKQQNQETAIKDDFAKLEEKFDARLGVFANEDNAKGSKAAEITLPILRDKGIY